MTTSVPREEPVELSRRLLEAVKRDEPSDDLVDAIADLDEDAMTVVRTDPEAAKAFWINCYNTFAQLALAEDPTRFDDRRAFFGTRRFDVAGTARSLDDIEHGILRGSKWKYGLGYIPNPFADAFERRYRLSTVDERIHFALNCGAASCPAILAYSASDIDGELEMATAAYLANTVEYDPRVNVVTVPRLCLWYRGDFGGGSGIRSLLERHELVPPDRRPRLRYHGYDWSLWRGKWADADMTD